MTAPTTTPEITRYRDAVRAALADLSVEDRDDLMEDVESHLTEVAAEDGGSLDRLGSPAEYAAELRTSAGLPQSAAPARTSLRAGLSAALADSALGRAIEGASRSPGGKSLLSFLRELQPGWWVLRGYLAAWLICGVVGFGSFGPLPTPGGSVLLGVAGTLLAIWLSVRLGRYTKAHCTLRPFVVAATVLLLLLLLVMAPSSASYYYDGAAGTDQGGLGNVTNIYVFDSEGRPLTGVQLFDQDGFPIQLTTAMYDANGMPVERKRHFTVDGREVFLYPREAVTGIAPAPGFSAPRLTPSVAPSPGASGSAVPGGAGAPSATPTPR